MRATLPKGQRPTCPPTALNAPVGLKDTSDCALGEMSDFVTEKRQGGSDWMGLCHPIFRQGRVKTGPLTELTKGSKGRNKSSHPHHIIIRSMLFPVRSKNSSSVKSQRITVRTLVSLKSERW